MSRHFASPTEPWFRIGRLEVSTVVLACLIAVASGIAWVVAPGLASALYFNSQLVAAGEVWRIVTWPLANDLWVVITALVLWYFGSDIERLVGRTRMAWLLVGTWAVLTAASTVVELLPALRGAALAGLGPIELAVLLLWIAEYPNRPFFFGIPAWIFGAIILGLQVVTMLAGQRYGSLLSLLLGFAFVAILGRRFGLLGAYEWVPGRPAAPPSRAPRVSRATARQESRNRSDREKLDALLDQINEKGIQSLTSGQKRELMRLRERLRRG